MWQKAAVDDLLSCHVANCSSWIGHHCRSVSTKLIDELCVPSCPENCTGSEQEENKVELYRRWRMHLRVIIKVPVWLSLTVHWVYFYLSDHREPVLLLLSDRNSSSLATWQFRELHLQKTFTYKFGGCVLMLQWFRAIVLHIPRSLKQSVLAGLGLITCTASQMAVFTSSPCATERRFTRIFSTLCFWSFGMPAAHTTDRRNYTWH